MAVSTSRLVLAFVALVAVAATVAVACGGSNETSQAPGQAQAHTDHQAEIDQRDMKFIPARVSVKVGDTVLIKNSETAIHTGNINGKNVTGNMKKGDTTTWTATEPGEYAVTCEYHPKMKATIVVTA